MRVVFVYENDGVNALTRSTGEHAANEASARSAMTEMPINLKLTDSLLIKNTGFMRVVYAVNHDLVCAGHRYT